jgi:hypothetical protein
MTAVPERLKVGWFPLGAAGGYRNDVIDFLGQDGELFQIAMCAPTGVEPAAMRGGPANVSWCRCWGYGVDYYAALNIYRLVHAPWAARP